jgi:hypothetical protein
MNGITFKPKLISKQMDRSNVDISQTLVLSDEALLNDSRPFDNRSKSQVFNRLFLDKEKY